MARFWVPPKVSQELLEARQQFKADLSAAAVRDKMLEVKNILNQFNYELKQIDPRLEMIRAQDTIPAGIPMKPGFYHLVRWNEGAPPSVWPIEDEHGRFMEPTSAVFEMLKKNDMWQAGSMSLVRKRQQQAEEAYARQKQRDTEERQAEIMERVLAATRAQVSMNSSVRWAQNAAGQKRTRGIKKKG